MTARNTDNKDLWEQRSSAYPDNIKSVIFKNFPELLNLHFDLWHKEKVLENIPQKNNLRILDLGCGYGRISMQVLQAYVNIEITGIDISKNFAEQFVKNTGHSCIQTSLEELPSDIGKFDCIFCVTALMYVEKKLLENVLTKMLSLLQNDGVIILIEPFVSGRFFSNGFGLFGLFRTKKNKLPENCFRLNVMKKMIIRNGGIIGEVKRMPCTTIFIVPLYLLSKIFSEKIMNSILRMVRKADKAFAKLKLPSMHILITIKKAF